MKNDEMNLVPACRCVVEYDYLDLFDAFGLNVRSRRDDIFVQSDDRRYTYGQAWRRVAKVMGALRSLGVTRGDRVAFLLTRGEWYVFTMVGILGVGASYVPIDDRHPDEYARRVLDESGARLVITDHAYAARVRHFAPDGRIVDVDDFALSGDEGDEVAGDDALAPRPDAPFDKKAIACVLFTSGTTGQPKGVCITRDGVANLSRWLADFAELRENDTFAMTQSVAFSAHLEVIFSSLYARSSVDIVPESYRFEPDRLNSYIRDHGITCMKLATPLGRAFIREVRDTPLRFLLVSGAHLGQIDADRSYCIVDEYGSTENTAQASAIVVSEKTHPDSIGFPIFNTALYVLDENMRPLPPYEKGMLFTAGRGVSNGYLNHPELTARSFVPNPFTDEEPFGTLYNTGDCAYVLPNGEVCCCGRMDGQVKIRGNRVELADVENTIRQIEGVDDAVVVPVGSGDDMSLAAYVTGDLADDAAYRRVVDYVAVNKPSYMVPAFVQVIDCIPFNVNGKVDKGRLPEVDATRLQARYVAPDSEAEVELCGAFAGVLGLVTVGMDDDFVRLGGDSLSAIEVASRLRGVSVTAGDVLILRTPRRILEHCETDGRRRSTAEIELRAREIFDRYIEEYERTGMYRCPISRAQQNIYIEYKLNEGSNSFNQVICVDLPLGATERTCAEAVEALCAKHPILRARFVDGEPAANVVCDSGLPVTSVALGDLDEAALLSLSREAIDLAVGVGRVFLVGVTSGAGAPSRKAAVFVLHHIVTDFTSNALIRRDFDAAVAGVLGRDVDLGFLAQASRERAVREICGEPPADAFFDELLAECDSSTKLDYDEIGADGPVYVKRTVAVPKVTGTDLALFCQSHHITVGAYLTSALAFLLSRFTFEKHVEFSVLNFGRSMRGLEGSVGYYVRTIPYLADCTAKDVESFLKTNAATFHRCMTNYEVDFQKMAKRFNLRHDIEFTYNTRRLAQSQGKMPAVGEIEHRRGISPSSDLVLTAQDTDEGVCVVEEFSSRYSDGFIRRFTYALERIIDQMTRVDDLAQIDYVMDEDRALFAEINATTHPLAYGDVIEGFQESVHAYPNSPLVTYRDLSLTYRQSAAVINELSSLFGQRGIAQQQHIAVFVERSHWYFLCAAAALAQGVVYVPIEVKYPDERIAFMLADADVKAVLVDGSTQRRIGDVIAQAGLEAQVINISELAFDEIVDTAVGPTMVELDAVEMQPGDQACILYTSGTTGQPKGNVFTRLSLINLNDWYVRYSEIDHTSIYALYSSFVFDMHTYAFFSVVLVGACVDIVPEDIRLDMPRLAQHFDDHRVTHTAISTQVGKLLLNTRVPKYLKRFAVAGEALGAIDASRFDFVFEDFYGPTESNVVTACRVIDKIDPCSIGGFVDNVAGYILDDNRNLVPFGARGELYLTGKQLVRGYLNRPAENAAAFLDNPYNFDGDPDRERMYKVGDVVRFLPDKTIGYIARADSQVKIRGNRVELTEVESVIRQMPNILDATVKTVKRNTNNELVAYVVSRDDTADLPSLVKEHVARNKPEYMVPTFVMVLDEIPLNVNGKVDRRRLPQPDANADQGAYVAPATDEERQICAAFARALDLERVGADDDFIRLGGDSLAAINVIAIASDLGIKASDVLQLKTPRKIAETAASAASPDRERELSERKIAAVVREWTEKDTSPVSVLERIDVRDGEHEVLRPRGDGSPSAVKTSDDSETCGGYDSAEYLSEEDRAFIERANDTDAPLVFADVMDGFAAHLGKHPDRMLVSDEDVRLTYGHSAGIVNDLSRSIGRMGAPADGPVAIFTERCVWYVLCALYALADGRVYVPIDTDVPDERAQLILEDSAPSIIFVTAETHKRAEGIVGALSRDIAIVEVGEGRLGSEPAQKLRLTPGAKNEIACILYTSGTTGAPKGVQVTRRGLANFAAWMQRVLDIQAGELFSMHSSMSFDAHFIAFYPAMLVGAGIDIVPERLRLDLPRLAEHFRERHVTHSFLTAQVAKVFVGQSYEVDLKTLVTGGEAVGDLGENVSYTVVDAYGPTEATTATNCTDAAMKRDASSVGRFMDNCKGYILAEDGRLAPVGAVGQLCLSGPQLAAGYLNRPTETARAFVHNPFYRGDDPAFQRMYKTGDLVRYLDDGSIGYVGRADSQVKIRGNRVELLAVDRAVREVPGIRDVAISTIKNGTNNEIVAYVVCDACAADRGDDDLRRAVTDHVARTKPAYMVPSFVVRMDAIPLTTNGKVDVSSLPRPLVDAPEGGSVAPTNGTEAKICDAFAAVLGRPAIGIDDDFIMLGGDSLAAIHLVVELEGMAITAVDVLAQRTPRAIAEQVSKGDCAPVVLSAFKNDDAVPFTQAQLNIYLDIAARNNADAYLAAVSMEVDGAHDVTRIRGAIDQLVATHPLLACRIQVEDAVPYLVRGAAPRLVVCDNPPMAAIRFFQRAPFDTRDALCRIMLEVTEDGYTLHFVFHHLIFDGMSEIALRDAVDDALAGKALATDEGYLRAASFEQAIKDTDEYRQAHEFFADMLGTVPQTRLPGQEASDSAGVLRRWLDVDRDDIVAFARAHSVTPNVVFTCAFAYALAALGETGKVCFSMLEHGRDRVAAHDSIGLFVRAIPLALDCPDGAIGSFVEDAGARILAAFDCGFFPYHALASEFGLDNSIHLQYIPNILDIGFEEGYEELDAREGFVSDIAFEIFEQDSGFAVMVTHSRKHSGGFAGKVLAAFGEALSEMLCDGACDRGRISRAEMRVPLSEPQLNVYLDVLSKKNADAYLNHMRTEVDVQYDSERVESALNAVIDAHPVLRTRLSYVHGTPELVRGGRPQVLRCRSAADSECRELLRGRVSLDGPLSCFLIAEDGGGVVVYGVFHHVIFDGKSAVVLTRDLKRALGGEALGVEDAYVDASLRDGAFTRSERCERAHDMFARMLDGFEVIPDFLGDVDGTKAGVSRLRLNATPRDLGRFAREHSLTHNAIFASAFAYTLSRFIFSDQVFFNIISNGRQSVASDDAIGMFARTLPVVIDCSTDDPGRFAASAQQRIVAAIENESYPYRMLASEYGIAVSLLFQYLSLEEGMSLEDAEHETTSAGGVVSDLAFNVSASDDRFEAVVIHSGKYNAQTVERFLDAYDQILSGMLADVPLDEIACVRPSDVALFDQVNRTDHVAESDDIVKVYAHAVRTWPDNVHTVFGGKRLTYGQTCRVVNRISASLSADTVAMFVPQSHWYVICPLAVIARGSAYVPLDADYPDERIAYILKDSQAREVLVDGSLRERAERIVREAGIDVGMIEVDGLDEAPESSAELDFVETPRDAAACILYTSGTTGVPKGVVIPRRALFNVAEWVARTRILTANDAAGQYSSIGFDAHILGIYAVLFRGARTCVVPPEIRLDLDALSRFVDAEGVTYLTMTTQLAKLFAQNYPHSGLKCLLFGGERLGQFSTDCDFTFIDGYGPCEDTCFCAMTEVKDKVHPTSVGKPISNNRCYILDAQMRQVPFGACGELCLSGPQLAIGYLNNPQATDAAFVANPYDADGHPDHRTIYRTGDVARFLPDGSIGFVGRKDSQVKVRGNRVEPSEVEHAIRVIEFVGDVTVAAIRCRTGCELVAYVVLSEQVEDAEGVIISRLAGRVPSYMVPSYVEVLDAIPVTVNGKVDRRRLPEVCAHTFEAFERPQTRRERDAMDCAADVLGIDVENFGLDSDLRAVGLDSLSAVALSLRYAGNLDLRVSVADILAHPSVKEHLDMGSGAAAYRPIHHFGVHPDRPQLVFVHPGQGGAESYAALADALGDSVSFSCMEFYNMYHPHDQIRGIGAIAQEYVRQLQEEIPHGPYRLGGWSYGGQIAFEMACQLRAQGETVDDLFLLDSYNARTEADGGGADFSSELIRERFEAPADAVWLSDATLIEVLAGIQVDEATYEPSLYDGGITLFKAQGGPSDDNYYGGFVGSIDVVEVECGHWDMMRENVARHIAQTIQKAIGGRHV